MEQQRTQKFFRQRKFLMALPLLALPFTTLLFWSLGGGQIREAGAQEKGKIGLNLDLPGANLKDDKGMDKMSYYDQAQTDSLKKRELMKNDPYYKDEASATISTVDSQLLGDNNYREEIGQQKSPYTLSTYKDANEAKVYDRLKKLDIALKEPPVKSISDVKTGSAVNENPDLDRLEQMMQTMQQGNEPDPEMQQLNGMMDRILDVQHPERVQEKLRKASEDRKGQVFAVMAAPSPDPISSLERKPVNSRNDQQALFPMNGFYGLEAIQETPTQNAIEAVIHEQQTVVSGATIKMRLLNDIYINGKLIPKDNFVYGVANLNGDRLRIQIDGIRYRNQLFPVALNIYDIDGLEGVSVPGAVTRDVAKQSADRSMQNVGLSSVDPSWQMQAAGAGVEAAKSLFSKKVKLIKVTLKAGYKVLLYDEKQKQSDK